jgi:hypothetical protein
MVLVKTRGVKINLLRRGKREKRSGLKAAHKTCGQQTEHRNGRNGTHGVSAANNYKVHKIAFELSRNVNSFSHIG